MRKYRHHRPECALSTSCGTRLVTAATALTFMLAVTACSTPMYPRKLLSEIEAEEAQKLLSLNVPSAQAPVAVLETAAGPAEDITPESAQATIEAPLGEQRGDDDVELTAPIVTASIDQASGSLESAPPAPPASVEEPMERPSAEDRTVLQDPDIALPEETLGAKQAEAAPSALAALPTPQTSPASAASSLAQDNPVLSEATLRIARFDPAVEETADPAPKATEPLNSSRKVEPRAAVPKIAATGATPVQETIATPAPLFAPPPPTASAAMVMEEEHTLPVLDVAETRLVPPPAEPGPQLASTTSELPKAIEPPPPPTGVQIAFGPGSSELPDSAKSSLSSLARQLSGAAKPRLRLSSFATDGDLSAGESRRLSLSRLFAVRNFLIEQGLRSEQMDLLPMSGTNEAGQSDRVDLVIDQS